MFTFSYIMVMCPQAQALPSQGTLLPLVFLVLTVGGTVKTTWSWGVV